MYKVFCLCVDKASVCTFFETTIDKLDGGVNTDAQ